MESNRTPNEIAERRDEVEKARARIADGSYAEIWRAMRTGAQMVADAFAQGPREPDPPPEPEPPTKAERIRECIAKIRLVDDGYDPTDDSATRIDCLIMVRRWGFKLIHLLEQDDPNVYASNRPREVGRP